MAGISGNYADEPFIFDLALLNPGNHFDTTSGQYKVAYSGLYQFIVTFQAHYDELLSFDLMVDGQKVAYVEAYEEHKDYNTISMTRNLHLKEGQVVSLDATDIKSVYGNKGGIDGSRSWFSAHLIYADTI